MSFTTTYTGVILPEFFPVNILCHCKGYHIYLYRDYGLKGVAKDLVDKFDEYSKRIGDSSVIYMPSNEETYEDSLHTILNSDPWIRNVISDPMSLPSGCIITKPSIQDFSKQTNHVFIYVSGDVINLAYHDRIELSQDIVDLCRHNEKRFIDRILPYSRNTFIDPGPRTKPLFEKYSINPMFEPNFYGIGFRIVPKRNNNSNITEESKAYDCIVRQF